MAKIAKPEHKATPFAVTDFETGGLDARTCAITEIAMVIVQGDTFEEIGRYESMVYPYYGTYKENGHELPLQYNDIAMQITGITIDALKAKGKPITEVAKGVLDLLEKAKSGFGDGKSHKPVFVAHNATFDTSFLQHLMYYAGLLPQWEKVMQGKKDFFGNYNPLHLDTILLAKILWASDKRMPNYKLETCVNRMGIGLNDAHRAMNDILATKDFMVNVAKAARAGEHGGTGEATSQEISSRKHFQF